MYKTHTCPYTPICAPPPPFTRRSNSHWRVNVPPPVLPVRLQLQGHRQLDREDPTGPTVVMVLQSSSLSPHSAHTHTHTADKAGSFTIPPNTNMNVKYDSSPPSANSWCGVLKRRGACGDTGPTPDLICYFCWIGLHLFFVFFSFLNWSWCKNSQL